MQLAILEDEEPQFFTQADKYINTRDPAGLKTFIEGYGLFHECLDDNCMYNLFEYSNWPGNGDIKRALENKLIWLLGKRLSMEMLHYILQLAIIIDSPQAIKLIAEKPSFKKERRAFTAMLTIALEKRGGIIKKESIKMLLSYGAAGVYSVCLKEMIESGGYVNIRSYDQDVDEMINPMTFAAATGNYAAIQGMLNDGNSIASYDSNSRTVLGWAAFNNNPACVKLLLKNGAKTDKKDFYGRTPLDLAYLTSAREAATNFIQTGGSFLIRELARAIKEGKADQQAKIISTLSSKLIIDTEAMNTLVEAGSPYDNILKPLCRQEDGYGITRQDLISAVLNSAKVKTSLEELADSHEFSLRNFSDISGQFLTAD